MSTTESGVCTRVHVKPAEGRSVRMPERNMALLPAEGQPVPHNMYWQRRIADGDVVIVGALATKPKPKGATAK